MAGVKTIRALARGLSVMRVLENEGPAALHELAARTALSKPTLLRVLTTLENEGYVRRGIGDRLYHRTVRSVRQTGAGWKAVIAEVAAPVLDQLCHTVLWPSDLGIYEKGAIHVQETTRRLSPFLLNRDVLRADIHVLPSAMGRAVLAWSSPARREAILREVTGMGRRGEEIARNSQAVDDLVKETLDKGYATRMRGYYITHRREASVSAIALPITIRGEAVGSVNLTWVSSALTEREFAARYLDTLAAAARGINEALSPRFDRLPDA